MKLRARPTALFLVIFLVLSMAQLTADDGALVVSLRGHLEQKHVEAVNKALAPDPEKDTTFPLVLEVNTTSGDLSSALEIAKRLYEWKLATKQKIIVYIEDNALGPGAIIPLLADEWHASVVVSWGDIPLNAEGQLPTNVLRSRIRSLIPDDRSHSPLLRLISEAMIDPAIELVDDNGWRRKVTGDEVNLPIITPEGETLVLGQNQLRRLGLLSSISSLTTFRERFDLTVEQAEGLVKEAEKDQTLHVTEEEILQALAEKIPYDPKGMNRIGYISITNKKQMISQATWVYVKSALDYYKKDKPIFIILELNTPGGEVFSAQKISDGLKEMDTQYGVPVVAFINNWAISAGAMLAYSCRFIAVTKDSSMGAAAPVLLGEGGQMKAASEKVNSALRADFGNRAGFFDRDSNIAEAMVDKDIILVLRRGEVVRLDKEEQIRETGMDPDEVITNKGKLLTLKTDQMRRFGVADIELEPTSLSLITEEERNKGKWPASKSLLFHAPFFDEIPDAVVDQYKMDWRVRFLSLLAIPAVSSILLLGMMLGFYMELNSPGFGFPGSFALICLILILLGSFSIEVASWLEVIFLLAGLVLIAIELFVIPGFGIAGVAGIAFFVGGLLAIMLPGIESIRYDFDSGTLNAAGDVFLERLAWLCGTIIVGVIILALLGRYMMPNFRAFNRLVLQGEQTAEAGYTAAVEAAHLPEVGVKGVALSPLRPAGKVLVADEVYEAQSTGGFIKTGVSVVVVEKTSNRLIVEAEEGEEIT